MLHRINKCILSVCDISPAKLGSFEEFLITLTRELNENKFKHVIIFREEPIKIVKETLLELGAEIRLFKRSTSNIYNFIYLHRIIQETKPSIVHFHFYPVYTLLNYLKFFLDIEIIYTDHMGYKKTNKIWKKIARRSYYYINSKLYSKGINKIICVSNFVKSKYSEAYGIDPDKMCVIYNGINVNRFKKDLEINVVDSKDGVTHRPVVTTVGLRRDKGPHYLMRIAPSIIGDFPNVVFMFVGEGECKDYLKALAIREKITENVIFTGNLKDIKPIYELSSCVAILSDCEEAFCFVAAEAMATKTNIIAFDSGAIKEVVFDKSQLIPKNCYSLSENIRRILENNNELSLELMRKHVIKNFSLTTCVKNYVALYEHLLNSTISLDEFH